MDSSSVIESQVSTGLEHQIDRALSGGHPLSDQESAFFESRFGYDFSNVRIHTNSSASESAHALQARAYTLGSHIVFAAGQYAPQTSAGQRLLSHELVHVVQQSHAPEQKTIQRDPNDSRVHPSPGFGGGNASHLAGIPSEKWSEIIEQQYRARGDTVRANAVRACRLQGQSACARILTNAEVESLYALARDSGGDRTRITVGMAGAAPLLVSPTT
ncbi:eCIS core domain-containing protein, partial [Oculatella sp. LEGE 06141]|uniref:eCIS core domain-containing protein n=1 Tax=Oculatella sp. LEGE 06141 TaxID=1828648 RepID=UPI001D14DF20